MSLPKAAGHPSYSSSQGGPRTFIPEIWSGKMIEKFYDATVLAAIANTDYEGEIKKQGDKVHIRTVPTATIRDYSRGTPITYERPDSTNVELEIDKGKYYAAEIDDVSAHQQDIKVMDKWATDASEQMKIAIDTDVLADIYTDAHALNKGAGAGRISGNINLGVAGSPLALTPATVLDLIVDAGTVLDEQNIPESGRYMVIPAWMAGMIKKSDLKDASLAGDSTSIMRNGRIGMIDRFTLYSSNLLNQSDGDFDIIAGHKNALTFASQMTEMESLRLESYFGSAVRGLQVFGYKVIDPTALVHIVATRA